MSFPSLRHSWLPAIFLLAAAANLIVSGPLFLRTAGTLGTTDLLFGFLFCAPLLLTAWWLIRVLRTAPSDPPKPIKWPVLACASLLGTAVLIPLGRTILAARELRTIGFQQSSSSSGSTWARWLEEREIHLAPDGWSWPKSYPIPPPSYPADSASLDRALRLLAICRTQSLRWHVSPELGLPPSVALLHDLQQLNLDGRVNDTNTDVLSQLPNLRHLHINQCTLRNLRTLGQAPNLRDLSLSHLESPLGLEGFPSCPQLDVLQVYGARFETFQGIGLQPNLRILIVKQSPVTDFSALAAMAPKLESLTITHPRLMANLQSLRGLSSLRTLDVYSTDYALPTSRVPDMPHLRTLILRHVINLSNFEPLAAAVPDLEVLQIGRNQPPIQGTGLDALTKLRTFHAASAKLAPATLSAETFRRIPHVQLPDDLYRQLLPERLPPATPAAPPSNP